MTTLIAILIVLASIALVLVVIVQKSKGGGLASGFSSANNIMGVRKATDGIEKATWYLMGSIMFLCIAYTAFLGTGNSAQSELNKQIEQKAATTPKIPTPVPVTTPGTTPSTAPSAPGASTPTSQPASAPAPSPQE